MRLLITVAASLICAIVFWLGGIWLTIKLSGTHSPLIVFVHLGAILVALLAALLMSRTMRKTKVSEAKLKL